MTAARRPEGPPYTTRGFGPTLLAVTGRGVSATLESETDSTLENAATGSSVSSLPGLGF
jgi:hypothetical protein